MIPNTQLLTDEVPVTLPDGTVLRCRCHDVMGEMRLIRSLSKRLYDTYGPGGYFAACKSAMDFLKQNNMAAELSQMVSELTRLTATKALPEFAAVDEFRMTPDGITHELYLRTRQTHPDLGEPLIRSQINNDLVAWDVYQQLTKGLAEDHKRRSAGTGPLAG